MRFKYLNVAALRAAARVYLDRQNPEHRLSDTGLCFEAQMAYEEVSYRCPNSIASRDEFVKLRTYLHGEWPHYSGDPSYPVPGHTAGSKPRRYRRIYAGLTQAQQAADAYYTLDRGAGAYGFVRRELAGYMGRELLAMALWLEMGNPCPDFELREV